MYHVCVVQITGSVNIVPFSDYNTALDFADLAMSIAGAVLAPVFDSLFEAAEFAERF